MPARGASCGLGRDALASRKTIRAMAERIQGPNGGSPLKVELLTGGSKGKARQKLLEDLGKGEVRPMADGRRGGGGVVARPVWPA